MDTTRGYVGKYNECLAQQESGAVLLEKSKCPGG